MSETRKAKASENAELLARVRAAARQEQFLDVVSADEARTRFEKHIDLSPLPAESVALAQALARVLAYDVVAAVDAPPFDRSNVDGFALRAVDTLGASDAAPKIFRLNAEVIASGDAPALEVAPGTATAIATGGVIPRGADAVVMIEQTELIEEGEARIELRRAAAPGQFVSYAGSDIARGETLLRRGTRVGSREIGMLAACGLASVEVVRKPKVAVLSTGDELVAPGTPLKPAGVYDSNGAIIAAAISEAGGEPLDVAGGFIELSAPPLRDAVSVLVDQGHRTLVAVPLMLSAAGHSKGDVPAALAREAARHPGLTVRYGRPLGPHPILLSLLAERISAAAHDAGEPYAVLVVGRGSTDPDANADVCKDARLLWEGRGYEFAETAFVSLARPSVAEGLERCRRLGARTVVVARYFLFPGVLPDRVAAQAAAYARAHPGLDIRCADVLGDCDEIAALVAERYREALDGDIRMNCDVCQYRVALPGLGHRVGAPQHPHDHPHDHVHGHADAG